jgi:hypothetical protein
MKVRAVIMQNSDDSHEDNKDSKYIFNVKM